jgi:hypothetical protein
MGSSGHVRKLVEQADDPLVKTELLALASVCEEIAGVLFVRMATTQRPYFIGFFPIENQRWLLSYIGVNKSYPPRGEPDFTMALERLGIDPGRASDGAAYGTDLTGVFRSRDAQSMAAL